MNEYKKRMKNSIGGWPMKEKHQRIIQKFNIPEMKQGKIEGTFDQLYNNRLWMQYLINILWLFYEKTPSRS